MIFFIFITIRQKKKKKNLDIRRDMKKILVGCCIDKNQTNRGTVKIRFTGWSKENIYVLRYLEQQQGENVRERW